MWISRRRYSQMNKLVANLKQNFECDKVGKVMSIIDRAYFCFNQSDNNSSAIDSFYQSYAYLDRPLSIGFNATISAPHMHAYALQTLFCDGKIQRNVCNVLDVGSGSGYLCAAFLAMMDFNGSVVGVEHIPELVQQSKRNLLKIFSVYPLRSMMKGQDLNSMVNIVCGDGRVGYPKQAPYDVIHVGAATKEIPKELIEQLNFNGRMMIPVGNAGEQYIMIVNKNEKGDVTYSKTLGVRYVPLTSKDKQLNS